MRYRLRIGHGAPQIDLHHHLRLSEGNVPNGLDRAADALISLAQTCRVLAGIVRTNRARVEVTREQVLVESTYALELAFLDDE